jgi:hypothetical protein
MSDLQSFYQQLAQWEGKPAIALAAAWDAKDMNEITSDFQRAMDRSDLQDHGLAVPVSTSNQAVGNRMADFFASDIDPHLRRFKIESCPGPGYPDRRLVRNRDQRAFVLEMKATTDFDKKNGNRMVLTSASRKLRRYFPRPIRHLLATLCYRRAGGRIRLRFVRLDFLQPGTRVNIRLEASVSKRILAAQSGGTKSSILKFVSGRIKSDHPGSK